jgi:hypothetical protein
MPIMPVTMIRSHNHNPAITRWVEFTRTNANFATAHDGQGLRGDGNETGCDARPTLDSMHLPPTCCKTSLGSMQAEDVGRSFRYQDCEGLVGANVQSARTYNRCTDQGCGRTFVAHADMERANALKFFWLEIGVHFWYTSGNERCPGVQEIRSGRSGSVHLNYQEIKDSSRSKLGDRSYST